VKFDLRKPCKQCPFRRTSARGWLGPWSPTDLLLSLKSTPFPCHLTIKEDNQSVDDPSLQGCAGAAIFLNQKIERSRCQETAQHQDLCKDDPVSKEAAPGVFNWSQEFIDHHTMPAKKKAAR